jgi:hypothetical protein
VKVGFFYFVFWDSNLRTFFLPPLLVNILCFLKWMQFALGTPSQSLRLKKTVWWPTVNDFKS